MSPSPRKKTARKSTTGSRAIKRAGKTSSKRKSTPAKKAGARKTASGRTGVSAKSGTARSAAKRATAKRTTKRPVAKSSATKRKTSSAAKTARKTAKKASARRPSASGRKTSAAQTQRRTPRRRSDKAAVAREHFKELLEAKQARVRQGPSYPAPNAFTGQREADSTARPGLGDESAGEPPDRPQPETTHGDQSFVHGRGNQGMRPQK